MRSPFLGDCGGGGGSGESVFVGGDEGGRGAVGVEDNDGIGEEGGVDVGNEEEGCTSREGVATSWPLLL